MPRLAQSPVGDKVESSKRMRDPGPETEMMGSLFVDIFCAIGAIVPRYILVGYMDSYREAYMHMPNNGAHIIKILR